MTQAEILFTSKSEQYYKNITPEIKLFNEYFGAGMSSIVFQELRESKALAYSVMSFYLEPTRTDKSNYIASYIGAQADKLPEAMDGLLGLMKRMPEAEMSFNFPKKKVIRKGE